MRTPENITSAANPLLKDVRRAVTRGSLTDEGWCIAETFHLLEEALRSGSEVKTILAAAGKRAAVEALAARLSGVRVALLPDAMFASIAATEHSQGVMALVQPREWQLAQLLDGAPLVVILDGLRDPGNTGTIIRSAEAFGATGVVFLKGTASPHNPKTLRASAGSLFRVPFVHGTANATAIATLRQNGVKLFAAMPADPASPADSLTRTNLSARCGLIVGNEAQGVGAEWRAVAAPVSIPTVGVESLNVAVATGILLYEARRQRMKLP
jgi:TrmH family RNA methyltransferase